MDMESMAKLLQVLMSQEKDNPGDGDDDSAGSSDDSSPDDSGGDFSGFFENIDFNMISKMGDLFSRMNKPDMNGELLTALKPHLRPENRHKVDTAVKISRMIALLPFLKESGILNNLF